MNETKQNAPMGAGTTGTVLFNGKEFNGKDIIGTLSALDNSVGFDTVICSTFDAIYNYLLHELSDIEEIEGKEAHTVRVIKDISNNIYDLCQKGKAEVGLMEAFRRAKIKP